MGGATCTFWNPFTNLWHWLPITRDNIRGKRIFHGEDPSAFRALPVQSQQIKPLSSILYHWRLIHRAWWHDIFSFQEEQGNFCKNISLGGYGSMIFFCTMQSLYLKVQIKTVIDSVHSLSLDKYMIFKLDKELKILTQSLCIKDNKMYNQRRQITCFIVASARQCGGMRVRNRRVLFLRWLNGKASSCQCKRRRRCGFDPWVRKILWSRKW